MRLLLIALVSFGASVASADKVRGAIQFFIGDQSITCVAANQCVGDELKPNSLDTDRLGGLSEIACGKSGEVRWIFLVEILQGAQCEKTNHTLWFRTDAAAARLTVEDGKIVKILRGPLHAFDP